MLAADTIEAAARQREADAKREAAEPAQRAAGSHQESVEKARQEWEKEAALKRDAEVREDLFDLLLVVRLHACLVARLKCSSISLRYVPLFCGWD